MSCQDGWQDNKPELKDTDGRSNSELLAQVAEARDQARLQQEALEAALLQATAAAEKEAAAEVRAAAAEVQADRWKQRAQRAEAVNDLSVFNYQK